MDNGGLQILPQTRRKIEVEIPGQTRNLVIGFVVLFIVAAGYFVLLNYRANLFGRVDELNAKIGDIDKNRDKNKEARLVVVGKQLSNVSKLLDAHISWSQGLEKFSKLLLPQVILGSVDVNSDQKSINFSASADSFVTVARQMAAFYGDSSVKDVVINGVSAQSGGRVEFSAVIKIDAAGFLLKSAK
ncbi:MAG: hypothetical protein CEN90_257 [Parcubacteria group bacterium Licking1014_17]|nr:MAG: hypothetical protein CEN90_257 [Parcubacteria group bacterium Licking1014_17]